MNMEVDRREQRTHKTWEYNPNTFLYAICANLIHNYLLLIGDGKCLRGDRRQCFVGQDKLGEKRIVLGSLPWTEELEENVDEDADDDNDQEDEEDDANNRNAIEWQSGELDRRRRGFLGLSDLS